ncbi:MAG: CcmD family protein [Candidatus Binatia bacterium]|nr:CcmD family protein [Candidatus Binatia bacterium]
MKGLNYLAAAYTGVWIGFFIYLMSLGRRARGLEHEVRALRQDHPD